MDSSESTMQNKSDSRLILYCIQVENIIILGKGPIIRPVKRLFWININDLQGLKT